MLEVLQQEIISKLPTYVTGIKLDAKNVVLDEPDPGTYTAKLMIHIVYDGEQRVAESLGGEFITAVAADIYVLIAENTRKGTYDKIMAFNTGFKDFLIANPTLCQFENIEYYPAVEGSENIKAIKIRVILTQEN